MSVKLSISIVAYNDYKDVKEVVTSIENYTSHELTKEIFIIDNGSTISSSKDIENIKSFLDNINGVEYLDVGENLGFGKGHNQSIPKINSEYHAILNPDILFFEDVFSKIIKWMDLHEEVGMVIPYITDEKGNKQEVYRRELTIFDMFNRMILKGFFKRRADKHLMKNMDFSQPFQVPFGQGSFLVVRSDLFKDLGGFDENFFMYCEDADLCKRVNQVSKLMYFPDAKVIHKWKKGSHHSKKLFKYHLQSTKYYFKKWGLKFF